MTISLTLVEAQKNKKLVSIHMNPSDQSRASVGFVDSLTDTYVRLKSVSTEGLCDGYVVRKIDNIFRVDVDGHYENKLMTLQNNAKVVFKEIALKSEPKLRDMLLSTLSQAKQKNVVVILWTVDDSDSIVGFVRELSDETITIQSIDSYGRDDGKIIVNLRTIVDMDCNTRETQKLRFLHEHRMRSTRPPKKA